MSATTSPRQPEGALGRPAEADVRPAAADGAARARPRMIRLHAVSAEDVLVPVAAAVSAIALVWFPYENVLPFSGVLGFWVCWYITFLVLYCGVTAVRAGRRAMVDRGVAAATTTAGVFALAIILEQVGYVVLRGWPAVSHLNFFTQTMVAAGPLQPLTVGGILHAVVGSLEQLGLATAFSVPLGITAALFLAEIGGPRAQPVRVIVTAMTALPEIVAGLFIYTMVIITLGMHACGFAASLALTVMMLPIVTRGAEVILRLVPNNLREASYALGGNHARTTWYVVLPTARAGLTTVSILGMARAVGETAPLLFTAGFTNEMNANPFSGPQSGLPILIWDFIRKNPTQTMIERGFGAGLALMIMVLVLFSAARLLGGKAPGEMTRRQRRRLARDSAVAGRSPSAPPAPSAGQEAQWQGVGL
jgi:phosphate transport system permease protein